MASGKSILSNLLLGPAGAYGLRKYQEGAKEHKAEKKLVKKGQKMAYKKEKALFPAHQGAILELKNILKHKRALPSGLDDIINRYEKAGRGAEKIFAPIREQALSNYDQGTRPQVAGQFAGGSSGSSAMNQALAASRANLERGLASDFAGLQSNLAQNLLSTSQEAKQQNFQNRLNTVGQILGQPTAYAPVTQARPHPLAGILPLAGTAIGGALAGPPGAAAGAQGGAAFGQFFN